jgi:hypothetical protein
VILSWMQAECDSAAVPVIRGVARKMDLVERRCSRSYDCTRLKFRLCQSCQ